MRRGGSDRARSVTGGAGVCRADLVGAAGYWKKAAKGGIAIAMYKLGTHFYRGDIASLGRSGEDAVMWLQRFLRAADPASAGAQARPPSQPVAHASVPCCLLASALR